MNMTDASYQTLPGMRGLSTEPAPKLQTKKEGGEEKEIRTGLGKHSEHAGERLTDSFSWGFFRKKRRRGLTTNGEGKAAV